MRIYLVGYMGSGKTTLGKEVARKLGFRHINLDDMIEKDQRKTIDRVFEEKGEEKFRVIETRILLETKRLYNIIVSTGGGTAASSDNMDWMNQNGITLYLKVSPGELFHRLVKIKSERPLIKNLDDMMLMEQIDSHLAHREPHYSKAKHHVKGDNITSIRILNLLNIEPVKHTSTMTAQLPPPPPARKVLTSKNITAQQKPRRPAKKVASPKAKKIVSPKPKKAVANKTFKKKLVKKVIKKGLKKADKKGKNSKKR